MISINDPLPNLSASTDKLLELKKDLESQILYHESAEGVTYYEEKPLLDKIIKYLGMVNNELKYRGVI